jgi:hypothetical protein
MDPTRYTDPDYAAAKADLQRRQREIAAAIHPATDPGERSPLQMTEPEEKILLGMMEIVHKKLDNWKLEDSYERQTLAAIPQIGMAMIYMNKALKCIATATAQLAEGDDGFPFIDECVATTSDHWNPSDVAGDMGLVRRVIHHAATRCLEQQDEQSKERKEMILTQVKECSYMLGTMVSQGDFEYYPLIDDRNPATIMRLGKPSWAHTIHETALNLGLRESSDSQENHIPLDLLKQHAP